MPAVVAGWPWARPARPVVEEWVPEASMVPDPGRRRRLVRLLQALPRIGGGSASSACAGRRSAVTCPAVGRRRPARPVGPVVDRWWRRAPQVSMAAVSGCRGRQWLAPAVVGCGLRAAGRRAGQGGSGSPTGPTGGSGCTAVWGRGSSMLRAVGRGRLSAGWWWGRGPPLPRRGSRSGAARSVRHGSRSGRGLARFRVASFSSPRGLALIPCSSRPVRPRLGCGPLAGPADGVATCGCRGARRRARRWRSGPR